MCRKLNFLSELCDAWSLRWVLSGSICVSVCRCWIFVSAVQPVMILSAVFWVVWSLLRFVSEMMGSTLVNLSVSEGSFPANFKTATVRPLLKKHSLPHEDLSSYRPISNLNFVSKVLERLIHTRLA